MRRLVALLALLPLAACAPSMKSAQPLFTAGGPQPRPGLWAIMDVDCAAPKTAAVQDWPKCAMPLWYRDGSMTVLMASPTRSALVLSDGAPRIAQSGDDEVQEGPPRFLAGPRPPGSEERRDPPEYHYYGLETDGAPVVRARVWEAPCLPEDDEADASDNCLVADAGVVRRSARSAMQGPPSFVAVWVAP